MRHSALLCFILLVIILLVIFGVYRLLTVEPIDGVCFDPASKPLVFLSPGATTDDAAAALAAFAGVQGNSVAAFFTAQPGG